MFSSMFLSISCFVLILKTIPSSWTVRRGDSAIKEISPKASNIIFPFKLSQSPIRSGRIKLAVSGPHTDPPASNDTAVNIFGVIKVSSKAMPYPINKK